MTSNSSQFIHRYWNVSAVSRFNWNRLVQLEPRASCQLIYSKLQYEIMNRQFVSNMERVQMENDKNFQANFLN